MVRMNRRRRQKGFSLPELMVVLAIIMLLVVLAVPRYRKSKQLAENAAAQANLKSIHTAQEAHRISNGEYAPNFTTLAGPGRSLPVMGGGDGGDAGGEGGSNTSVMVYHGYIYRMTRPLPDEYTVTAEPVEDRASRPTFTINQTGSLTASGGTGGSPTVGGTKPPPDKKKDEDKK